ncbi:ABC transporter ATP-binding protein [Microvirga antarctica]|uniref:ABC transporter ATP-binding protein n=1 Tax=Microvirga antarctica TaxID=2819233 RepID=UPI001B316A0D|nr:ABC transporter ATP-binding protein [Microvirga antarctica]
MNRGLLEARNLRMDYGVSGGFMDQLLGAKRAPLRAVDDVSLTIAQGETLALVGESGSGKTTTGRIITRLERPTSGSLLFEGRDVTALSGAALRAYRRHCQMIFQNPYESFDPRLTVGTSVAEPLRLQGIDSSAERRERVMAALDAVDLRPSSIFSNRFPTDLSGGQLQRVSIARALVLEPKLVVADEPVSMLDVSIRASIMTLMLKLQERMGLSYLYITHDLAVARHMSSRIAVMYLGTIVEEGPTDVMIAGAAHPYTRLLVAAVPEYRAGTRRSRIKTRGEAAASDAVIGGCRFHPRCPLAADICREVIPPRVNLAAGHFSDCHFAETVASRGLAVREPRVA